MQAPLAVIGVLFYQSVGVGMRLAIAVIVAIGMWVGSASGQDRSALNDGMVALIGHFADEFDPSKITVRGWVINCPDNLANVNPERITTCVFVESDDTRLIKLLLESAILTDGTGKHL